MANRDAPPQGWDAIPDTPEQRAYLRGWNDAMAASIRRAPQPPAVIRRERIATAMLTAALPISTHPTVEDAVAAALQWTDALIAALDEGGA